MCGLLQHYAIMVRLDITWDISKAFGRVWHEALLATLPSLGLPPYRCDLIIANFLIDRTSRRVKPASSSRINCVVVSLKDVFSPLLHLSYLLSIYLDVVSQPTHMQITPLHRRKKTQVLSISVKKLNIQRTISDSCPINATTRYMIVSFDLEPRVQLSHPG